MLKVELTKYVLAGLTVVSLALAAAAFRARSPSDAPSATPAPAEKFDGLPSGSNSPKMLRAPFDCESDEFAFRGPSPDSPYDFSGLPRPISDLSRSAGSGWSVSPQELLGPLLNIFAERRYEASELHLSLEGLANLVEQPRPELAHSRETIVVYVDPLCDHCKALWGRLQRLAKQCPRLPLAEVELLPARTTRSLDAAALLQVVRERTPDQFIRALELIFEASSEPAVDFRGRLQDAGIIDRTVPHKELGVARQKLREQLEAPALKGLAAPLVIYRGRSLERRVAGDRVFDPASSDAFLLWTFAIIEGRAKDESR